MPEQAEAEQADAGQAEAEQSDAGQADAGQAEAGQVRQRSIAQAREQFDRQGMMATLGARLEEISEGHVEIVMPVRAGVTQHDGFVHAGAVTSILDTACGFAARTLMPPDSGVLSVDFTVHLMRPAVGRELRAVADVVKAGRTITFVRASAFAVDDAGQSRECALMTASMTTVAPRSAS